MANPIYQDLYPVTPNGPQTTWMLPHPVVGLLPYTYLPPIVPPPTPTDLQPSASGIAAMVSPTNHINAPDDITNTDDEWDPYSESDSSFDADAYPHIEPMSFEELTRRVTDIRTLKREQD